jgi:hypothetical protein
MQRTNERTKLLQVITSYYKLLQVITKKDGKSLAVPFKIVYEDILA